MNARPEQYAIDEYAYLTFEDMTPYPGAEAGVRAQGEPIYAESSDQEYQISIALETANYFIPTPQS